MSLQNPPCREIRYYPEKNCKAILIKKSMLHREEPKVYNSVKSKSVKLPWEVVL